MDTNVTEVTFVLFCFNFVGDLFTVSLLIRLDTVLMKGAQVSSPHTVCPWIKGLADLALGILVWQQME